VSKLALKIIGRTHGQENKFWATLLFVTYYSCEKPLRVYGFLPFTYLELETSK